VALFLFPFSPKVEGSPATTPHGEIGRSAARCAVCSSVATHGLAWFETIGFDDLNTGLYSRIVV
jgi:hypothetical protein